jgi:hypothetical protein
VHGWAARGLDAAANETHHDTVAAAASSVLTSGRKAAEDVDKAFAHACGFLLGDPLVSSRTANKGWPLCSRETGK